MFPASMGSPGANPSWDLSKSPSVSQSAPSSKSSVDSNASIKNESKMDTFVGVFEKTKSELNDLAQMLAALPEPSSDQSVENGALQSTTHEDWNVDSLGRNRSETLGGDEQKPAADDHSQADEFVHIDPREALKSIRETLTKMSRFADSGLYLDPSLSDNSVRRALSYTPQHIKGVVTQICGALEAGREVCENQRDMDVQAQGKAGLGLDAHKTLSESIHKNEETIKSINEKINHWEGIIAELDVAIDSPKLKAAHKILKENEALLDEETKNIILHADWPKNVVKRGSPKEIGQMTDSVLVLRKALQDKQNQLRENQQGSTSVNEAIGGLTELLKELGWRL